MPGKDQNGGGVSAETLALVKRAVGLPSTASGAEIMDRLENPPAGTPFHTRQKAAAVASGLRIGVIHPDRRPQWEAACDRDLAEVETSLVAAARASAPPSVTAKASASLRPDSHRREVLKAYADATPAAPTPAATGGPERREQVLAAAVSAGKLTSREVGRWRSSFDRDPEGITAMLDKMVGVPNASAAADAGAREAREYDELLATTRARVGMTPADSIQQALAHSPQSPPPAEASGLTRTEHGSVLYDGTPTKVSDRGTTQVFSSQGWLDVAEFEARGLTSIDAKAAIHAAQMSPNGTLGKALSEATAPAGGPLGVA